MMTKQEITRYNTSVQFLCGHEHQACIGEPSQENKLRSTAAAQCKMTEESVASWFSFAQGY
jgi:hypothetical protein